MLEKKKKYLQVALNSTLSEAYSIISQLPPSDRILIEAGTPLIKQYGIGVVGNLREKWGSQIEPLGIDPYIVADLKTMDRGETEVRLASFAGASGAIALGQAPLETINIFIESCKKYGLDSMIDMMNIDQPVKILLFVVVTTLTGLSVIIGFQIFKILSALR